MTSGTASAVLFAWAKVPGISPWLGEPGSTFSTIIFGIGALGVAGRENSVLEGDLIGVPSWTIATSSGTASCVRISYAAVPGTWPYLGLSSTFSTRVNGMGDRGDKGDARPSRASENTSSSSFEDSGSGQYSSSSLANRSM